MHAIYQAADMKALIKAFTDATEAGLTGHLKNFPTAPGQGFLFLGVPEDRPFGRGDEIKLKLHFMLICTALDNTRGCTKVDSMFAGPGSPHALFRLPDIL